jgi:hypothetical protein
MVSELQEADLSEAHLGFANLSFANLAGANFSGAFLSFANLTGARLDRACFNNAIISYTLFAHVDLSKAMGLETIQHLGPSTISIDAILESEGKIPESFLRDTGFPNDLIADIRSIVGSSRFYSCFISYSSKDQEFAERLHSDLQAKGVRCWFAQEDVHGGRKLHEQIDQAIRLHDKLLLILSENSMKSEWVATEIYKARKREFKEGRRVLFPIRLVGFKAIQEWECFDGDSGKDMAREIREYFILDFSDWKDHDSYQKAFDRLLRDLKSG